MLGLGRYFTLCLGGYLRLIRKDIDVLPSSVSYEDERTLIDSSGGATLRILGERRPLCDKRLGNVVQTALNAGQFRRALTPRQGLLQC